MGLLAPPVPGSLLKTGTIKPADPIKKKTPGEKPAAKEKSGKKAESEEETPEE